MATSNSYALNLRLKIMTILYLPILLYAMSTFDLQPDALVIGSDNLEAFSVPEERSVVLGDEFSASLMYQIVPTPEQMRLFGTTQQPSDNGPTSFIFDPEVRIDYSVSPESMTWDAENKRIVFNTANVFEGADANVLYKDIPYRVHIRAVTAQRQTFERTVEETFRVFRPMVQVQSNAPPRVVADSRNSLNFGVQGINDNNLILHESSTNRRVEGARLDWTPRGDTTVVTISFTAPDGVVRTIDRRGFRVTPPPNPVVGMRRHQERQFLTGNEPIDLFGRFEVVIRPDDNFLRDFPQDARYEVGSIRLSITRAGLAPEEIVLDRATLARYYDRSRSRASGEDIYGPFSLGEFVPNLRGNGLNVFIEDLNRVNYENRRISLDLNEVRNQFSFRAL